MQTALLYSAAAVMLVTAITHSYFGERRLLQPLLARGMPPSELGQRVLRFAWHMTSVLMLVTAFSIASNPTPIEALVIGSGYLAAGLYDLWLTRGRHIGWPMLALAGVLSIVAAMLP